MYFQGIFWLSLTYILPWHCWICSWESYHVSRSFSESYATSLSEELSHHSTDDVFSHSLSCLPHPSSCCPLAEAFLSPSLRSFLVGPIQHLDFCYSNPYTQKSIKGYTFSLIQLSLNNCSEASSVIKTHGSHRAGPTSVGWASFKGDALVSPKFTAERKLYSKDGDWNMGLGAPAVRRVGSWRTKFFLRSLDHTG